MAKLKATRQAQYVLEAEFTFNFDDTVINTSGVEVDGGKTNVAATAVDIIELPYGATIVGGEVVTDTAFDAATFNVTVVNPGTTTQILNTVSVTFVSTVFSICSNSARRDFFLPCTFSTATRYPSLSTCMTGLMLRIVAMAAVAPLILPPRLR